MTIVDSVQESPLPAAKSGRALDRLDPVTFEVIRHRLWSIQGELGSTIKAMSGSPTATEAGDFNTALMDSEGNSLLVGVYISTQASTQASVVRSILADYGRDYVRDGDMFLCNDPWKGALHQSDVACVAPVFIENELVAWVGSVIHQLDIGGPVAGGFAMGARSIFDEPTPFPPVRIVENGKIRMDVEAGYLRRSRLPNFMRLDLRAQIGANNIGMERIKEVAAQYGVATLKDALAGMIELVERKLRARLAGLPRVKFREIALMDDDGVNPDSIYAVVVDVENTDEGLRLDFSESSKQAPALINAARPALEGGVMAAVMPLLCYDMPWTPGGIERCVEIISRPGTICDATWPAGVSGASVFATRAVTMLVGNAIGRLWALSDQPERANSTWSAGSDYTTLHGERADGRPIVASFMETGRGFAAYRGKDGLDTGGILDGISTATANVEKNEAMLPVLYLFRRESRDTGGPGQHRGGVGCSYALQLYGLSGTMRSTGQGNACPVTLGLGGGQPGPNVMNVHVAGAGEAEMDALNDIATRLQKFFSDPIDPPLGGTQPLPPVSQGSNRDFAVTRLPCKFAVGMKAGDIYAIRGQGGGGYGDAYQRDVDAVIGDFEQGFISRERALSDYAVEIDGVPGKASGRRVRVQREDGVTTIGRWTTMEGRVVTRVRHIVGGEVVDDSFSF